MSLSDADRKSVVNYRVERAYATLKEAEDVATRGWYNLAANRLYYALYYAVSALLINNGLIVKTHSGINAQFNLHFVKTGILDLGDGALLSQLYSLRQSSDYEDFKQVTAEQIQELFPKVSILVDKLKNLSGV